MSLLLLVALGAGAGTLVQFRTTAGNLDVDLYDEDKPVTVQNFLRYVQGGFYQNMFLHRCIPGFIVQGGGYLTLNTNDATAFWPTGVYVIHKFGAITNEFNVGRRLTNSFGTLAMAKVGSDPNSASSEWFFNLTNNGPNLDFQNGGFTVFGRAVSGTNVLNAFNARNKTTPYGIVDLTWWWGPSDPFGLTFQDLPVNYAGAAYPRFSDLVYVYDISLLQVQVQPAANCANQISWNSVAGRTNYVEFSTNLPPTWRSFIATNGTGALLKVLDSATNAPRRFYRVRVDY